MIGQIIVGVILAHVIEFCAIGVFTIICAIFK